MNIMGNIYGMLCRLYAEVEPIIVPDSVQKARWKEVVERLTSLSADELLRKVLGELTWFGLKLLLAIAIFLVGRWLINKLMHVMSRSFARRHVEVSVQSFLRSLVAGALYLILFLLAGSLLGFDTTSFVALLAASGFGIGMALSGTLQNFAGGVMIMFMKPYRVGDYIEAQDKSGTVKEIKLFSTVITTVDNKRIYIPNSSISSAIVNNFSVEPRRRVDWTVSLAYGDDIAVAKRVILEMVNADPRTLRMPDAPADPFVALAALADSSINLTVRVWTNNADYWGLYFDMNERFYNELPDHGLHFPFPQLDVHLDK